MQGACGPKRVKVIKVYYAINIIHKKAFRSDLSTHIKKSSSLTNYLLPITISCYLFVLGSLVRLFPAFWAMVLISYSPQPNWAKLKQIDNNDNNGKYNNRHISTEIINFEKTETTWDEYRQQNCIDTWALNKY